MFLRILEGTKTSCAAFALWNADYTRVNGGILRLIRCSTVASKIILNERIQPRLS